MSTQKLLEMKNKKKSKNPTFLRQDHYKKKKISKVWRKSRGWDSKQRKRMQRQVIVEPGYGTPSILRGMSRTGLIIIKINSKEDLKKVNHKEHGVIISRKMGFKKKLEIIAELLKQKVKILNIKNPEEYVNNRKEQMQEKKKEKKEEKAEKKETKKKEEKDSIEDKLSEEDKKKLEKKEIDRLLTKKF